MVNPAGAATVSLLAVPANPSPPTPELDAQASRSPDGGIAGPESISTNSSALPRSFAAARRRRRA
ncbi:Uncharacterised protein [Mycobacterium tuberculosis]|nr:Uncharacterised protein [Mycobacterium tuberculosis]